MNTFNWLKEHTYRLKKFLGLQPEPDKEKIEVLNAVKLFEFCRDRDLIDIAEECCFHETETGEKVIQAGTEGEGLYMVDSGKYQVLLDPSRDPVAQFGPGDYFGEMSLIDNQPRSADVVCEKSGRLLFFSRSGFRKLLKRQTQASFRFLLVQARTLSQRLREANKELQKS